jgi:catechol 2,3-dioxygenase-like lactoylglutathione lyase family enzyme
MAAILDHTIVDVVDREETIRFYTEVLGFEYGGSTGSFEVIKVNDDLSLDLATNPDPVSRHFAFAMERPIRPGLHQSPRR